MSRSPIQACSKLKADQRCVVIRFSQAEIVALELRNFGIRNFAKSGQLQFLKCGIN